MPESAGGGCCRCCCSFIFTLGLSALFLWLSLRTSDPTFSIEEFSVVNTNPSSTNISFLLKLNNPNKDKGIYYDDVNLAFFLVNESDRKQDTLVANYTVPRFYQGHKKSAKKNGTAATAGRVKMTDVAAKNSTAFRVDLATAVRFKIMAWDTKRHRLKEAGVVSVNATGVKPKAKKGVKLKSGAVRFGVGGSGWCVQVGFLVSFLILGLLDFGL